MMPLWAAVILALVCLLAAFVAGMWWEERRAALEMYEESIRRIDGEKP